MIIFLRPGRGSLPFKESQMTYIVYGMSTPLQHRFGTMESYIVSDMPGNWDEYEQGKWKPVAEFHVSQRHTMEEQRQRAHEYCDYMNSRVVIHPPIGT